ncbi:hypothetical protein BSFA1_26950 [Burkholderia sp. SFA1]|nr:hypothetical protein BSFA1_26950 [Burkholderia sp. SFA1]
MLRAHFVTERFQQHRERQRRIDAVVDEQDAPASRLAAAGNGCGVHAIPRIVAAQMRDEAVFRPLRDFIEMTWEM